MKVNAVQRLNYVLSCFKLTFPIPKAVKISYSVEESDSSIFIPDLSDGYFENLNKYQSATIHITNIFDERIPLLFQKNDSTTPYEVVNNRIVFHFDIISEIFMHLSGWYELLEEKDTLNRYIYEGSLVQKLGIIKNPVVNYLFLILKEVLELQSGIKIINKIHPKNDFVVVISHDVDLIEKIWHTELKKAIKEADTVSFVKTIYSRLVGKYRSDTFDMMQKLQEKYDFKSTFFFLARTEKFKTHQNADYDLASKPILAIINRLVGLKNEIGIHGGFKTSESEQDFKSDQLKLSFIRPSINRFHYLMFDRVKSIKILETNKIKIDSSLGFNAVPGFRNATSFPYFLFDFTTMEASSVIEVPQIIMDVSLFDARYLDSKSAQKAFSLLQPILVHIKKTGGILTLNWHNNYFTYRPTKEVELLELLIKFSVENKGVFKQFAEILDVKD